MKTMNMIYTLFILNILDVITTIIGVGYLEAIELNPIFYHFPNLLSWSIFKIVMGTICLYTIIFIQDYRNRISINAGLIILNTGYTIVVMNNIFRIWMNL